MLAADHPVEDRARACADGREILSGKLAQIREPEIARWTMTLGVLFALVRRRGTELVETAATRLRRSASAVLELAGIGALVKGAFVLAPWLGWGAVGVGLLAVGYALEPFESSDGPA